ncbi:hypothetical protein BDF20DRAFT_898539 [Mycotypha africana]|uniref:uncharacterized protein n=1 Tax=Mycotypha africana TaxID=64632 RepID=UPI0023009484|nr:uncharacterized protein BDF20DRAFT_898539 [Mycotypha africana]KAI8968047.1 hypothetical protein BDF20DRAFT_898539 [Mycotypha africana]
MTGSLTPYEEQRLKNIERNKALLQSLEIESAKDSLTSIAIEGEKEVKNSTNAKRQRTTTTKAKQRKVPEKPVSIRKSSRLRGEAPLEIEIDKENNIELLNEQLKNDPRYQDILDEGKLLTAKEYFSKEIREKAIITDGHFKGWVNPVIVKKYGLESSATEAWEKNGGGTYSFLDPTGSGKKRKRGSATNAKADASKMFKKNPNQYFYRLNEPGEVQWFHDWSEEEKALFIEVAKEHGCGDKWGLFASYIPHRVGYQCSSFYRHEIIKNGIVFDPNFQFTPSGEPVYVGANRSRR